MAIVYVVGTNNDVHVVVGSEAYGSWAVIELAEGGPKNVMFEAGGNLGIPMIFVPRPSLEAGLWGASNRRCRAGRLRRHVR